MVDATRDKAITIDPDRGEPDGELGVELRKHDTVHVSGSPFAQRLYAVASRGVVIVCGLAGGSCENAIPLRAESKPGPAIETGGRLFVPNYQTGEVWIIDLVTRKIVANPQVPTLAEYLLRVRTAASPGTCRTYGTYWDGMAAVWVTGASTRLPPATSKFSTGLALAPQSSDARLGMVGMLRRT